MAQVGRVKIIKEGTGGIVTDKNGTDLEFFQMYHRELGLTEGDVVRFDPASIGGKTIANNVIRKTVGTINSINTDNSTGTILEKEPNPRRFGADGKPTLIPFFQSNLAALGIRKGDEVHYDLIVNSKGEEVAVNVVEN